MKRLLNPRCYAGSSITYPNLPSLVRKAVIFSERLLLMILIFLLRISKKYIALSFFLYYSHGICVKRTLGSILVRKSYHSPWALFPIISTEVTALV